MPAYFDSETNKKKGTGPFFHGDDSEGKIVIEGKAWQSLREKLYYYRNEDILFTRLPRFARNDTFSLSIFNKSVT